MCSMSVDSENEEENPILALCACVVCVYVAINYESALRDANNGVRENSFGLPVNGARKCKTCEC